MNARKTLVSLLTAGVFAVAATASLAHGGPAGHGMMGGASPEAATQRLADLKTALKLTPAQQSAWSGYEQAVARAASGRAKLHESMEGVRGQPEAMADWRVAMLKFNAQSADEINQARKALVATLSPEQKSALEQFRPGPGSFAGRGGHGHDRHGAEGCATPGQPS